MSNCLFCKFVSGEIPTTKVYEDEKFIIIKDIDPKAVNHYLAIPKKHYKLLSEMEKDDSLDLGYILKTLSTLTKELHLENGYRLVVNQGDDAGQSVPHLHIHVLSGQKMGWNPAG